MSDIKTITVNGTQYDIKDATARADCSDLKSAFADRFAFSDASTIANGSDFNDLTTCKAYYFAGGQTGAFSHCPINSAGILIVEKTSASSGTYCRQTVYQGSTGYAFTRRYNAGSSSWSDWKNAEVDIASLQDILDEYAYFSRTKKIGTGAIYTSSDAIVANIPIYFRAVNSTSPNATGLTLYGVKDGGATDTLGVSSFGETIKVTPTIAYVGYKVSSTPYSSGNYSFDFDFVQAEYGIEKEFYDNWQETKSNTKAIDAMEKIAISGYSKLTSSGKIFDYSNITQGQKYRIYTWNMAGMNTDNPVIYLFYSGGSYDTMTQYRKIYGNTYCWEFTIPANAAYIRLYANKASEASYSECNYAMVLDEGTIIDALNQKMENKLDTLNRTTCKIFKKVVCCGDSYTSGHIQTDEDQEASTVNEEFAWPHFMSTMTGNEWINCGCSGCNVLTWQVHERGLPKAQAQGHAQAYVIGLMINDQSDTSRHVDLGTSADIGTNAQTYYGGMSKIIRELNAISPLAKIFVNTCPKTGENYADYNQAVRDIVEAYKNTYPVFLIDLSANYDLFRNRSLTLDATHGHYTAIGYEQFAEIYAYILSDYINNNVEKFQNVYKIPYTGNE